MKAFLELDSLFLFSKAIGFNVETVAYKNLKFQVCLSNLSRLYEAWNQSLFKFKVWDLGGQTSIRYNSILFLNYENKFTFSYLGLIGDVIFQILMQSFMLSIVWIVKESVYLKLN